MKLVDMKNTKAEAKAESQPSLTPPEYPWGLQLNLDRIALEKLDIDTLPKVGARYILTAAVEVSSVSEYESQGGMGSKSLGLQITAMTLEAPGSMKDVAKALYEGTKA